MGIIYQCTRLCQKPSEDNKVKFIESFNENIIKLGNGNSKLTGGLYWIAQKLLLTLINVLLGIFSIHINS